MSLDFALPLGAATINSAVPTTQTGTAQQDVYLERLTISCDATATNDQMTGIVTRATVANQSIFTSSAASCPVEMFAPDAQADHANVLGVALASGSSVEVIVVPDAAADISGMVGTAPVPAGVEPSGFSLSQLSMVFQMGDAGAILAAGGTATLTATCSRACQLGQIFGATDVPGLMVNSIQIAGEEQLAGAGEIGVNSQLGFLATDQDGHSLQKQISPGEQVSIGLINQSAVATNFARFGIYCI